MNKSILIIEDEEGLRMTLSDRLRSEAYIVDLASDGPEGLKKATNLTFDLIILDIMLPRRSGLDVCRDIRAAGFATPILLLTARDQIVDKVVGLKFGADDYVTKPFDTLELMARVDALLRRSQPYPTHCVLQFGMLRMDVTATEVTLDGKEVELSAREYQLLKYFMEHPGETLSRKELLEEVWGYEDGVISRTVDVYIASLRQKLEKDAKHPELILTVQRTGYKFNV
jgi:two-component system, OmpR family, alkaline phosphatase synthesis response regulator PhoP